MGRPGYKFDAVTRRQVAFWTRAGFDRRAIAAALGVHRNTLRKHFRAELFAGTEARRMAVYVALYKRAIKGHVGAARLYVRAWRSRGG